MDETPETGASGPGAQAVTEHEPPVPSMLFSLTRRLLLLLATLFLGGFALVFVHGLHQGITLPWPKIAATGAGCALLAVLWNWLAMVKTDDYLVPNHARLFFLLSAVAIGLGGAALFTFFIFTDRYPNSYLVYFGLLPAIMAGVYVLLAVVRLREAYALPATYRPDKNPAAWGTAPAAFSLLALGWSGLALTLTVATLDSQSRFDATMPERTDAVASLDPASRASHAEELFKLGQVQKRENRYRHAFELFQKAATLGHRDAHYELGLIYRGDGYLRDPSLAYRHFQEARALGHLESTFLLGRAYRLGELGLTPDYPRAAEFLEVAALAGHLGAQTHLGHLYNRGQGVEANPEKAFYWFKQAAEQGDPVAQNDVGIFYIHGTGVEQDPEEGVRWLEKAAAQGATVAEYNLARILHQGEFTPRDFERAFTYFRRLAEKNLPYGFLMIGLHHFHGHGVPQDYAAAADAFAEGAARHNADSEYHLGYCYLHGLGRERDSGLALGLLENAAARGHLEAQLLIARLYLEGTVILQDRPGAAAWFRAAAAGGSETAAAELEQLEAVLTPEELAEVSARYALLRQQGP